MSELYISTIWILNRKLDNPLKTILPSVLRFRYLARIETQPCCKYILISKWNQWYFFSASPIVWISRDDYPSATSDCVHPAWAWTYGVKVPYTWTLLIFWYISKSISRRQASSLEASTAQEGGIVRFLLNCRSKAEGEPQARATEKE